MKKRKPPEIVETIFEGDTDLYVRPRDGTPEEVVAAATETTP